MKRIDILRDMHRRAYIRRTETEPAPVSYSMQGQGKVRGKYFFVTLLGTPKRRRFIASDWRYPVGHRFRKIGVFCDEFKAAQAVCLRLGYADVSAIERREGKYWQVVLAEAPRRHTTVLEGWKKGRERK